MEEPIGWNTSRDQSFVLPLDDRPPCGHWKSVQGFATLAKESVPKFALWDRNGIVLSPSLTGGNLHVAIEEQLDNDDLHRLRRSAGSRTVSKE